MGMFSRAAATPTQSGRPSSDDQLIEIRNKARRRLIGAVVLVLAAVVLIPIFLSDQSQDNYEQVVSVIPSIIPPSEEQYRLSESLDQAIFENSAVNNAEQAGVIESPSTSPATVLPPSVVSAPATPKPVEPPPKPAPKPEPKPEPKSEPKPKPKPQRTDDGSAALALLEGTPASKPAAADQQGSFVLQIGAYSSKNDADQRRAKLVAAGVSNAYVETATVSGKAAYRLRIGPFPSRQAVQAAQTRMRSLGYENSFVSTK